MQKVKYKNKAYILEDICNDTALIRNLRVKKIGGILALNENNSLFVPISEIQFINN